MGVGSGLVTTGEGRNPPEKFSGPLEKFVGQSLKNMGPSQKTLYLPWCPKMVTGLVRWGEGIGKFQKKGCFLSFEW